MSKRINIKVSLACIVVAAAVFVFDLSLPLGIAGGVPYVALVLIGMWAPTTRYIYLLAAAGSVLTVAGYFYSDSGSASWVVFSNRGLALFVIWSTAILVAHRKQSQDRLEQSRNELERSEERSRDFADAASDWLWEMDDKLRFSYLSGAAGDNLGRNAEQSLGRTRQDLYGDVIAAGTPEEQKIWHQHFADIEARRPFENFEQRWTTPSGETRFFSINGKPLFDAKGNFSGYRGTASNITERKLAEVANQRFLAAIENLSEGIAVFDVEDRLVMCNKQYRLTVPADSGLLVLGTPFEDIMRASMKHHVYPEASGDPEAWLLGRMESHRNPSGSLDVRRGNRHLLIREDRLPDSSTVLASLDVTEQKQREELLRQSQKMDAVGQLTGGIAHEFNNLLQVVSGNITLLEYDIAADSETGRQFEAINRNVARGAELTDRLLSFARKQPLAPQAVEIAKLLAEMQYMLVRTLGETIEIKVVPAHDVWGAEADPGQLENALLNLALNARDAMPDGGLITLSTNNIRLDEKAAARHEEAAPGEYVMLSVADGGSGMSEEDAAHAFEPFFTTKDVGKGTGLGLSMVYGFAQQSGGFAEIESEIGAGTTVRLYLPRLIPTEDVRPTAQDSLPEAAPLRGGTILLVEDDADVRSSLTGQLIRLGYRVIEAEDGATALAALDGDRQIDLLFTDVVMPGGVSGLELARQVLSLRPGLKVIYTTGYSEDILADLGPLQDAAIVLRKPYDKAKLAHTISQILN